MKSKLKREWDRWPVPDDWDEERDGWMLAVLCIPNSRTWRGIFMGHIDNLAYGRNWNRYSGTITDAQEIANVIVEGMSMACLDDVVEALNCLCRNMQILGEVAQTTGGEIDAPPWEGIVQVGEGEQFPDTTTYFDAKCRAANAIYDTLLGMVDWLEDNDVDVLAGLFGGVTTGLIVGLALAGPLGWAVTLTVGIVALIAGFLARYALNLEDVRDAMDEQHEECVKALYNSGSALAARSAFVEAVADAATATTVIERELLELLASNEMLNQLYEPREDIIEYSSPDPITCSSSIDILFKTSETSPYNVITEGVFLSMSAGASHDADGFHLPDADDWIKFTVTLDTPAEADVWNDWAISGELYLTASPSDGSIRMNMTNTAIGSGSFQVDIFPWPQTQGVWKAGSTIHSMVWADAGGGSKFAEAVLTITAQDGDQVIRKLLMTYQGTT